MADINDEAWGTDPKLLLDAMSRRGGCAHSAEVSV